MPPSSVNGFDRRAICKGLSFKPAEITSVSLDQAEEGGFPTTGGAHDGDELAGFEAGVDVLQDLRLRAFGGWGLVA